MTDIIKEPFKAKERGKLLRELKTDIPYHVINYLNKKEIGVMEVDTFGRSPFMYAVMMGASKTIDYFLTQKLVTGNEPIFSIHMNYQKVKGTALHYLSEDGSYNPSEMIKVLIKHDVLIDAGTANRLHDTPLVIAIQKSKNPYQAQIISSLVRSGADCFRLKLGKNNTQFSPFFLSIKEHQKDATYAILENALTLENSENVLRQARSFSSYKLPTLVQDIEVMIERLKIESTLTAIKPSTTTSSPRKI